MISDLGLLCEANYGSTPVVAAKCNYIQPKGTTTQCLFAWFDTIDKAASTIANGVITNLQSKDPLLPNDGWTYTTFESANVGSVSLVQGTYANSFQHDVTIRCFIRSEATKQFVNNLLNSRVCIILEMPAGSAAAVDNTVFEAYGFNGGLKMSAITSTTEYADGVVYEIVFTGTDEDTLPKSVWKTDYKTTVAMLAAYADEA